MRKGLIKSPYARKKPASSAVLPSMFDTAKDYATLQAILSRLEGKEEELDRALVLAEKFLEAAKGKAGAAQKEIEKVSEMHAAIRYIRGKDGVSIQGKPGRDGKDADEDGIVRRVMGLIRQPKDGVSPVVDYDRILKEVGKTLDYKKLLKEISEKLTINDIPGLRGEIDSYRNQMAVKRYGENTWARGGGDTVVAGTNVTIAQNENGQKVISANGGGSSILTETVVATDAGGNNVNIDLAQLSQPWTSIQMVIRNGVIQNQNKWSIVGDTLTLTGAVSTNDFQIQYTYA